MTYGIYICHECKDAAYNALLNNEYKDYLVLTKEEVKILSKYFENDFIPANEPIAQVMNKLFLVSLRP